MLFDNFTVNCICTISRFKDHVQNNNPKHFLSEEEFVQMRLELAAANKPSGEDEGEETPTEELPPGTEDLPDPAKVRGQAGLFWVLNMPGIGRILPDPGEKQNCTGLKRCLSVSSQ